MGLVFFFFQAEDGIRDESVTGVQTCALPICTWTFYALLGVGIAACVGLLLADEAIAETPVLPYTYVIIDTVAASFGFVALLVPIAYGGELIWRDRKSKIAAIVDATPTSNWIFVTSKIIAIAFTV